MFQELSVDHFVQWQQETFVLVFLSRLVPFRYLGVSPGCSITLTPNGLWGTGKAYVSALCPVPQCVYPLAGLGCGVLLNTARVTASAYKHALG